MIDQKTQYRVSNVISRDVVFDVLAQDGNGKLYNIEIQRADTIDHPRRVALYAAELVTEFMRKGSPVDDTPEVYIFYLSETDLLRTRQCIDWVGKKLLRSGLDYEDGIHIAFANAEVDDASDVAKLMQYFKKADPDDPSQGALPRRVFLMKREKEGEEIMCQISDKIFSEGKREGKMEGRLEGKIESIINLASKMSISDDTAMELIGVKESDRPLYANYVKTMRAARTVTNPLMK